jgi:hypothetical protein
MAKVSPAAETGSATLLKEESTLMSYCGAMTTITFFTGGPAPVEAIRARLAAVVAANPWLAGRLVRGKGEKRWRLTFDPAGPLRDGIFTVARPGQYAVQGVSYAALQKVLRGSPLEVKGGTKAVNKGAVLVNVTVIPDGGGGGADGPQWALTVSMSHTIADGYTYYRIYNMLSAAVEVAALSPARKESFSADLPAAVGRAESRIYHSASFALNCAGNMVFGGAVRSQCRLVDKGRVEAAKAAAKGDGDSAFVSTNDVLTAAWGKLTRAQLLEMPINLRNRLPGIGDADAGNYEWVVMYQEEDFLRPGQIRKSLSAAPGRYVRCGRDPPRPLRSGYSLMRARYSLITNWTTFAQGLELPGCAQRLHLPFFNLAQVPCEMAFVFRATSEQTGVLMLSRKLRDGDLADSVFGATVDPVIFPPD